MAVALKGASTFSVDDWVRWQYECDFPKFYHKQDVDPLAVFPEKIQEYPTVPHRFSEGMTNEEFNKERVRVVAELLELQSGRVSFVDHHTAHAAYANYALASPQTDKVIVTADSFGDGLNATVSLAKRGGVERVIETARCDLGRIYKFTTLLLGMKPIEDEHKVMGLAPYANPYVVDKAYKVFDATLKVRGLGFEYDDEPAHFFFYFQRHLTGCRFDGIAGAVQAFIEDRLSKWLSNILVRYGVSTVAFSGGLAMNVKLNKRLAELEPVAELVVPPSGGDESLCIGGAYHYLSKHYPDVPLNPLDHVYLGPEYDNDAVLRVFQAGNYGDTFDIQPNVSNRDIAQLLAEKKIVARMAGRMEFGARALGHRSILAHPGDACVVGELNEMVKSRDFWMPFAPSILRERAHDYIVYPTGTVATDNFMTVAFDSTPLARRELIAALHPRDHTLRPHVVCEQDDPDYYDLLRCFQELTGIGGLVNTSFNLHGSPIVGSPDDAFFVFKNSGLQYLVVNDLLFSRKRQRDGTRGKGPRRAHSAEPACRCTWLADTERAEAE